MNRRFVEWTGYIYITSIYLADALIQSNLLENALQSA